MHFFKVTDAMTGEKPVAIAESYYLKKQLILDVKIWVR